MLCCNAQGSNIGPLHYCFLVSVLIKLGNIARIAEIRSSIAGSAIVLCSLELDIACTYYYVYKVYLTIYIYMYIYMYS